MRTPLILSLLFSVPAFAAGSGFEGCQGLEVTRSRDLSTVDVSADLKQANKRINDICGKVIPKKQRAIDANADSCISGSQTEIGPGLAAQMKAQVQSQMAAFDQRVKAACEAMKKTMEESKHFCAVRKSSLDQLNKGIASIEKAKSDQASSQQNVSDLYGSAVGIYEHTAKEAGAAKDRIYAQLPDKDENRSAQARKGNESATTQDLKTDKLIAEWKSTLVLFAKDNKKKAACQKLSAKGGQLDEMSKILKNNLWPNGKIAARAIARVESADKAKAGEFGGQKAEADKRLSNSKITSAAEVKTSDISGTEEPKKMTPAEFSELNKKSEDSQILQAKALKAYKESGATGPEAISAAIAEAKNSKETPAVAPVSAARQAVSNDILGTGTASTAVAPGSVEELNQALRQPASIPETYTPPEVPCIVEEWSWTSFSYERKNRCE